MNLTREETELRRAWTTQLYDEHEWIRWNYRMDLKRPMIEVCDSKSRWGDWDASLRILRLSADLIMEYSWDVVINILKHEMAHQIVTELFGSADGHGDLFQSACDMIGVPEPFRRSGGDIPRRLKDFREDGMDSDRGRMLEKVKKLLSLAQSNNENEAFQAMKKANELIEKFNIERIERNKDAQYVYAIINHKKKRIENDQRRICLILQDYFFTEIVYSYLYDAMDCETYRTIEILGTRENVVIAEYVYYFLLNQLDILWKAHRQKNGNRHSRNKRSYRLGVIEGFRDKMRQMDKKRRHDHSGNPEKTTSALICGRDKMLSEFINRKYPRLTKLRSQAAALDFRTYTEGVNDGKHITIHKGITKEGGFQGRLLSAKNEEVTHE